MSDSDPRTYKLIGGAMRVHRELGSGLREKPYENALAYELKSLAFDVEQQRPYPIRYRDQVVGDRVPDLTIDRSILIGVKAVREIGDAEEAQMLNYLRISGVEVGLLINFYPPSLDWRRLVMKKKG